MMLCDFAQQYGEFAELTKREEAGKPPVIVGLVGGYALRDAPTLNSVFFHELPDVPEKLGFQQKKETEAAFKEFDIVYLDVNYVRLFRNYLITCDESQLQKLQQEFDVFLRQPQSVIALQHLFRSAFNYNDGEKCPGCELCAQAVIDPSNVDFFRGMIDNQLVVPSIIDNKRYIDERAIVIVLPVHSQLHHHCDKVVLLQDGPETRQAFLNAFPDTAKREFIQYEGVMHAPPTIIINIEGKTTEEVVESINELL